MTSQPALNLLMLVCGYLICIFVGLLAAKILLLIYSGNIDLTRLISEPTGDASLSRFQFLIFTFVIALSLFLVILSGDKPGFPYIPPTVLTLLGISGSSYLVSKGIQFSDPAGITGSTAKIIISPTRQTVRYGETLQFNADIPGNPDAELQWQVTVGEGSIDSNGLYKAPDPAPADSPERPITYATIQVMIKDDPENRDLAVVTLK